MAQSNLSNLPGKKINSASQILALLPFLLISLPLAADVYRCEIDDVTVFSDQPCQANARPYQSGQTLSISGSAEGLAETAARNQAWLRNEAQRRQERQAAVADRAAVAGSRPPPSQRPVSSPSYPWGLPYLAAPPHDSPRRQGSRERQADMQRPRQAGPRDGAAAQETQRQSRFSALSGRQPGSRRESGKD